MYKVALERLRTLFKQIHPTWADTPSDAEQLEKGNLVFDPGDRDMEESFNTGNVEEWDFTLMSRALLKSKKCEYELSRNPKYSGYIRSIDTLRKIRNKIGHPSKYGLDDTEFQTYKNGIKTSLTGLGVPAEIIEKSSKGKLYGKNLPRCSNSTAPSYLVHNSVYTLN